MATGTPLGNLVVNLSLEGSQFSNSLQGIRQELRLAQSAMRTNLSVLGNSGSEYNKVSQKVKDLNVAMATNERQVQELKRKYDQAAETYGKNSTEAQKYGGQLNRAIQVQSNFERELKATEKRMAELRRENSKMGRSMKGISDGFDRAAGSMNKFKDTARNVSRVSALALSGIVAGSIKVGSSFQSSMSQVAATMGKQVSEIGELSDLAKEMGATTKFTATQAGEAMNYMALAGWDNKKIMEGLPALLNLAAAGGMDLATASDLVTDGMTGMGLGTEHTQRIVDLMAKTASSANTNVEQMGKAFVLVAGQSNTLGIEADDLAQAIGLMANAGFKGEIAGQHLSSGIRQLSVPTNVARKAMEKYNVEVAKTEDGGLDLGKTMDDLREKMSGLSRFEQAEALSKIFGADAQKSWAGVVNATAEDYEKLKVNIDEADGAAKKMADTMQDNLAGKFTIFKSAVEGAGIKLFEYVGPHLEKLVEWATGIVDRFASMSKGFQSLIIGVIAVGAILGPVVAVLATVFTFLASAFSTIATSGIIGFLGGLVSPVLLVVGVVAALVAVFAVLWKRSEEFRTAVKNIIGVLKEVGKVIVDNVISVVKLLVTFFKEKLLPTIMDFVKFLGGAFKQVSKVITDNKDSFITFFNALKKVAEFVISVFGPVFSVLLKGVFLIVKGYIQNIINVIGGIVNIFSGLIKFLKGVFTGDISLMWEGIKQIFNGALVFIINLISMFFIGKILGIFKGFAGSSFKWAKDLWDKVGGFFGRGLDKVKNLVTSAKDKVIDIFGMLGVRAVAIFENIIKTATSIPQKIISGFTNMKSKLVSTVTGIGTSMKNGLIKGLNGMIGGVNWILEKLGLTKFKIATIALESETKTATPRSTGYGPLAYAKGTRSFGHPGGPALVNDGKGSNFKELIINPDGSSFIPQGRNILMPNMAKGTHVLSGNETKSLMDMKGVSKYAKGTGFWDGVKGLASNVWDAISDPIGFFKKMISSVADFTGELSSLPKKMVKGSFDLAKDKTMDWFKGLMGSDEAQSLDAPGRVTAGASSNRWGVRDDLMNLSHSILPKYARARITSGLRPGAITAAGTLSDHGSGRALDIGGYGTQGSPMYRAIAEEFYRSPYVKYVIANNQWKQKGRHNWMPYKYGGHMNHAHISAFANGGIVDRATLGVFGEAGKEALIPLSDARRSRGVQLLNEAAGHLGKTVVGSDSDRIADLVERLVNDNKEFKEILLAILAKNPDIQIDGKTVVKLLAGDFKEAINTIDRRNNRNSGIV